MADIGWRRRRGSSSAARRGARQRAGLTLAFASNTLHASGRRFIHNSSGQSKNPIDSDHGIYRDPCNRACRFAAVHESGIGVVDGARSPASKCRRVIVVRRIT